MKKTLCNVAAFLYASTLLFPQQLIAETVTIKVTAKRHILQSSAPVSSTTITKQTIEHGPQGEDVQLPKLLSSLAPGIVQGPFGQLFIRGNHASIQYQIDGVQLPDSLSNTFGQVINVRDIEQMDVVTGGLPAEFGQRLSAVVNIKSKSGPEKPGGTYGLGFGSNQTFSPNFSYGGSTESGKIHYYVSASYSQTNRGLDTPQPQSQSNQKQGGTESIHNDSWNRNEFAKLDWVIDNSNKLTFSGLDAQTFYQIPNYPSSFKSTDAFFQPSFTDQFGNEGGFNYVPYTTNNTQLETNRYAQTVWKHTIDDSTFFQLAPYWKYSALRYKNDLENDLAAAQLIEGATPSSFSENRHVNNLGLKGDYTKRLNEKNLIKAGFQTQYSRAQGSIGVTVAQSPTVTVSSEDSSPSTEYYGSAYIQNELTLSKKLILNAGLRFDVTQFTFSDEKTSDSQLSPRIGLTAFVTDTTKLHAFYGKLFQPAPLENLRSTFTTVGGGTLSPYDIKAEKDDYYEIGISHECFKTQLAEVNFYYKNAQNMLDHSQLLNTSISQPFNLKTGYAYGAEFSIKGQITPELSNFINYSYDIAKGKGISGGIFAFSPDDTPGTEYQFLDHVQVHTVNFGLTYAKKQYWVTAQGQYGSGFRTGPDNAVPLPSHFTADATIGYAFHSVFLQKTRVSLDGLNLFNNVYPITIANGFNGSHYAAGRQFILRLSRDF